MTIKINGDIVTLINDSEENDDWMKALPGYRKGEQRAHKLASRIHHKKIKTVKLDDATTELG